MQSELQVLEQISHHQMVRIYELLHDDLYFFIVTELVEGGDLLNHLMSRNKLKKGLMPELQVR